MTLFRHIEASKLGYLLVFLSGFVFRTEGQAISTRRLPMISAHRGASLVAPENTKASFIRAIELGTDFIEVDVRTSSDGGQVVMHDRGLKRTTGLDAAVDKTSFAEISNLSAGAWFGKQFAEEKVPSFEDVCELVAEKNRLQKKQAKLYVDCKSIEPVKVIQLLTKYSLMDSAVFYGDIKTLSEIKKLHPRARVMPAFPGMKDAGKIVQEIRPYAFDVSYKQLDQALVSFIHGNGIKVFSDLLGHDDNPEAYRKAIALGIDLIQTDDVSSVHSVLKEFESKEK